MEDIRKQFSLDWLAGDVKRHNDPITLERDVFRAVARYSAPIIEQLESATERRMGLYELARKLNQNRDVDFDTLWEAVLGLTKADIIEFVDTSEMTQGDYTLHLKDTADRFVRS
jgi:hypothetical protein